MESKIVADQPNKKLWILTPVLGTLLFIALYMVAAHLYPGGSQMDKQSIGFSWINNYWCNLLYEDAINGQHNPAKPIAIAGMFVICLTLSFFWFLFPRYILVGRITKMVIQIPGLLSTAIALLLFTNFNHDLMINLASGLGVVATNGIFIGLYKNKYYKLLAFGFLNLLLIGLNNYVYYTNGLIIYLPLVQKITFASFLIWVCSMAIYMYRKSSLPNPA